MEGMRHFSFDSSSERTAGIGCKPVRLMNSPGGLCLWMQKALKTPESKQNQCKSVLICVNQCLNIIRENSWINHEPFFAKRTQFSGQLNCRNPFYDKILCQIYNFVIPKTTPIRTQFLPAVDASEGGRTQFLYGKFSR